MENICIHKNFKLCLPTFRELCDPVFGFDGRNQDRRVNMQVCVPLRTGTTLKKLMNHVRYKLQATQPINTASTITVLFRVQSLLFKNGERWHLKVMSL